MADAPPEPTYTLDEAQRALARRECMIHGHDYDVVVKVGENAPQSIHCARCGDSWKVEANDA